MDKCKFFSEYAVYPLPYRDVINIIKLYVHLICCFKTVEGIRNVIPNCISTLEMGIISRTIWFFLIDFLFFQLCKSLYFCCCWSIVDLQSCVNFCCTAKWLSYTYTYCFLYSFLLWLIPGYWIKFPVLCSRTLLFIHSVCIDNGLHLLNPSSLIFKLLFVIIKCHWCGQA